MEDMLRHSSFYDDTVPDTNTSFYLASSVHFLPVPQNQYGQSSSTMEMASPRLRYTRKGALLLPIRKLESKTAKPLAKLGPPRPYWVTKGSTS